MPRETPLKEKGSWNLFIFVVTADFNFTAPVSAYKVVESGSNVATI